MIERKIVTVTAEYFVRNFTRLYERDPKNNRYLNVARQLEVVARCAARCRESTQYSSSTPREVSLG
jgi:hypothetical protein